MRIDVKSSPLETRSRVDSYISGSQPRGEVKILKGEVGGSMEEKDSFGIG